MRSLGHIDRPSHLQQVVTKVLAYSTPTKGERVSKLPVLTHRKARPPSSIVLKHGIHNGDKGGGSRNVQGTSKLGKHEAFFHVRDALEWGHHRHDRHNVPCLDCLERCNEPVHWYRPLAELPRRRHSRVTVPLEIQRRKSWPTLGDLQRTESGCYQQVCTGPMVRREYRYCRGVESVASADDHGSYQARSHTASQTTSL
jgi:hypothetical protein